mgnify:CR=1 FL=1
MVIQDSSDSNPCFKIVTCAGESQSGLHIEKWEFSDTGRLSHRMIILQVNHNLYDVIAVPD